MRGGVQKGLRWAEERAELLAALVDSEGFESGVLTLERPDTGKPTLEEWFALETPTVDGCPACGTWFRHVWDTVDREHVVIVWPGEEDPNMLRIAADTGYEPVLYEGEFGPAISWYEMNPS